VRQWENRKKSLGNLSLAGDRHLAAQLDEKLTFPDCTNEKAKCYCDHDSVTRKLIIIEPRISYKERCDKANEKESD
jgi:hypothetical protein